MVQKEILMQFSFQLLILKLLAEVWPENNPPVW